MIPVMCFMADLGAFDIRYRVLDNLLAVGIGDDQDITSLLKPYFCFSPLVCSYRNGVGAAFIMDHVIFTHGVYSPGGGIEQGGLQRDQVVLFNHPFQNRDFMGCRMFFGIGCSAEPIHGLIVQDNHSIIHPAPEKIVIDVFDHVFYFSFALGITFATKPDLKWPALAVR